MEPFPVDLFGEVPVSLADIQTWLDVVARIERTSWRREHYARSWNVADKVRQAKLAGRWPEIENARTDQLRALLGDGCRVTCGVSPWP